MMVKPYLVIYEAPLLKKSVYPHYSTNVTSQISSAGSYGQVLRWSESIGIDHKHGNGTYDAWLKWENDYVNALPDDYVVKSIGRESKGRSRTFDFETQQFLLCIANRTRHIASGKGSGTLLEFAWTHRLWGVSVARQ